MKISTELAKVLADASKEVGGWPKWKRSMDPIGDRAEKAQKEESKASSEPNSDGKINAA